MFYSPIVVHDNLKLPLCPKCGDTKHVETLRMEDVKRHYRFRRITEVPQPVVLEGTLFKCNKCDFKWKISERAVIYG